MKKATGLIAIVLTGLIISSCDQKNARLVNRRVATSEKIQEVKEAEREKAREEAQRREEEEQIPAPLRPPVNFEASQPRPVPVVLRQTHSGYIPPPLKEPLPEHLVNVSSPPSLRPPESFEAPQPKPTPEPAKEEESKQEPKDSEPEPCLVCRENIREEGIECTTCTECKKSFHIKCIAPWFGDGHNTCPNCRRENSIPVPKLIDYIRGFLADHGGLEWLRSVDRKEWLRFSEDRGCG
ncbi:hypothetical protein AGMMS49990_08590 [Endomicrobiia bacterium]|nr:hypothetical protein AGMMS49990_08590 [Endomicrobiia bacterium]